MQLQTQRLLLRHWESADLTAIQCYATDMAVLEFVAWGPNSEADTRAFIERAQAYSKQYPQRDFELAIVERLSGDVIGGAGIHVTSVENQEAFIGYTLRRESWGRGYATELARRLLEFGFQDLKLHRVFATCDTRNQRSRRVLEKVGMRQEGHLRENMWLRGRWRDSLVYAVLQQDFVAGTRH